MDGLGDAYMALSLSVLHSSCIADVPCTNSDILSPPIFDIPHLNFGSGTSFHLCVVSVSKEDPQGCVRVCVGSSLVYLFTG